MGRIKDAKIDRADRAQAIEGDARCALNVFSRAKMKFAPDARVKANQTRTPTYAAFRQRESCASRPAF